MEVTVAYSFNLEVQMFINVTESFRYPHLITDVRMKRYAEEGETQCFSLSDDGGYWYFLVGDGTGGSVEGCEEEDG
jgi:hypothetical protein